MFSLRNAATLPSRIPILSSFRLSFLPLQQISSFGHQHFLRPYKHINHRPFQSTLSLKMPLRPAISSQSLGLPGTHALFPKLKAASEAGFQGVEIFFDDLNVLANVYAQERLEDHGATERVDGEKDGEAGESDLLKAAEDVRRWCDGFGLKIVALQPFRDFEGLKSAAEYQKRVSGFKLWLRLCRKLDTQTILIPSNTLQADELDDSKIVPALREAADLAGAADPPVQIAFEALAWATLVNTWDQAYSYVLEANRENLGICIDTFNLAGKVYADPASPDGLTSNADQDFEESIRRLKETVDVKKIFYVQFVDGERLDKPLVEGHPWYQENQPARMTWSRNARCFAFEKEGYLPVGKVMEVLVKDLGYDGWISSEVFHRDLADETREVPVEFAGRGMESWKRLQRELGGGEVI
ncbi:3-dehydroshikimate dehydratase [Cercospora beticola]|uniref:3-dehydroshikimate dehydratase n=1 Tax=Cercospora beticola TaxID=122368 RepID=A0A2G5HGT3_CERBT|nr:3-dehydroshikimate dehydratase [Cercospora beticola]PIA91747.1 3-dehydroshikimate dehydratase [Cercospora beticola]WPB06217.1 hypothetical protein RHO25_010874 [Cercospora beticola]CAK1366101.1 unnamed protein product [Cercospora beticola]